MPISLSNRGRILISCPDRPGIVAAVSRFLFDNGANIVHSDQHSTDAEGGVFVMRVDFALPHLEECGAELEREFAAEVAAAFDSTAFVAAWPMRIINIHHSFLPAFVGAKPYEQAYDRGVKLIGATAHYVTEDLDAGPIIEQGVERVGHGYDAAGLRRVGRLIERTVLARAVSRHVDDRVIVLGNRTVVFA